MGRTREQILIEFINKVRGLDQLKQQQKHMATLKKRVDAVSRTYERSDKIAQKVTKVTAGFGKQGKRLVKITETTKDISEKVTTQKKREVERTKKLAEKQELLKQKTTALTRKNRFYANQSKKLGVNTAAVNKIMGMQGLTFNKTGKVVDLAGRKIKNLSKTMKKGKKMTRRFHMEFLSVMFFGMMLQRVFTQILRVTVGTFTKIMESSKMLGTAVQILGIHWEFLKFTIGSAINRFLEPLMPLIIKIINWLTNWIATHPKLVAMIVLLGFALGALLFLFGTLGLAIGGLIMAWSSLWPFLLIFGILAIGLISYLGGLDKIIGDVENDLVTFGLSAEEASAFGEYFRSAIPAVAESLSALSTTIAEWIMEAMPHFIKAAGVFIKALGDGFIKYKDEIADAMIKFIEVISEWIGEHGVKIVELGAEILEKILDAIEENKEIIADAITRMIELISDFINDNIPTIIKIGETIAGAMLSGMVAWFKTNPLLVVGGILGAIGGALAGAFVAGPAGIIPGAMAGGLLGAWGGYEAWKASLIGALPILQGGGQVLKTGMAIVHKGETVTPAGETNIGGITINVATTGGVDAEELAIKLKDEIRRYM